MLKGETGMNVVQHVFVKKFFFFSVFKKKKVQIRSKALLEEHLNFTLPQNYIYLLLVNIFDSSLKGSFRIRKAYVLNLMS